MTRDQEMQALADEYEAGLNKCTASGYEEYGPDFQRRQQLIIDALRAAIQPQQMRDRDEIAKRIAFAHLGDDREWTGFRSHADRFLAYAHTRPQSPPSEKTDRSQS